MWCNGCKPPKPKAPPHPKTQTGPPAKRNKNRQSGETGWPPPASNKPMPGLPFTWRSPFSTHFFFFSFLLVSYITVFGMSTPWNWLCKLHKGNMWFHHGIHIWFICDMYKPVYIVAENIPYLPPPSSTVPPHQTSMLDPQDGKDPRNMNTYLVVVQWNSQASMQGLLN